MDEQVAERGIGRMARTDRKIAANMVVVAAGKGITAITGLAIMALLTRHLGPNAFGEYRTVLVYASFAYLTSDLGLYAFTLRAISEPGADKGMLVAAALKLRLLLALIFLLTASALSLALPFSPIVRVGIALSVIGYLCHSGSDLLLAAFQHELRQYQYATTEVIGGLITLLAAYLIVSNDLGVLAAVAALVGGFVVTFASNLAFIRRSLDWGASFDGRQVKQMLTGSLPFAGALIFGFIYSRLDIVFLALLQSPADVGIYAISHKVSDVSMALPYFFAGLVLPALTAAAIKHKDRFAHILSRSYVAMCASGVGMTLVIVLFAEVFIDLLAGSEYIAGTSALQIMGVKIGIFFVANLLVFATTALNLQYRMLRGHGIAAIVSIVAYAGLIPLFSYDGAAISATIAEIVILYYAIRLITAHAGRLLSPAVLLKCIVAAIISYLAISQTFIGDTHWIMQLVLVGPLYLFLLVALRTGVWSAARELVRE
jgi:O-antigen/teichoic acid export membrane protein